MKRPAAATGEAVRKSLAEIETTRRVLALP